jgi:L-histidine N-alpha-methyltransferase
VEVTSSHARLKLIAAEERTGGSEFADAVRAGLTASPKRLDCRYFYDERGSQIFEEICALPEYYLTRTEHEILRDRAMEIAEVFGARTTLVELGSGSAIKTRTLIEAFLRKHGRLRYVPLDISRTMLEESAHALLEDYPGLEILAIAAEYDRGLRTIHAEDSRRKLVLSLGSSLGNFHREDAASFLARVRQVIAGCDRVLLGVDLRKDPQQLVRAYDDATGVTARFNQNLLVRINRELGGHFDVDRFAFRAVFEDGPGRVESYLVSRGDQRVAIDALGMDVAFADGETIHTENSYKYSLEEIDGLAETAGFTVEHRWLDRRGWFSVSLLAPNSSDAAAG